MDARRRRSRPASPPCRYDFLVSRSAAAWRPRDRGLAEPMGRMACTPSTRWRSRAIEARSTGERRGAWSSTSRHAIRCPWLPSVRLLADYYFTAAGRAGRRRITLVTPYAGAFTSPNANRVLTEVASAERERVADCARERGCRAKTIPPMRAHLGYDLLCAIRPLGPQ